MREKLADFWAEDFAAYVIQHVMPKEMEEVPLQVGKMSLILTERRIWHRKKIESCPIYAPEPWTTTEKVRKHGLMMRMRIIQLQMQVMCRLL